MLDDKILLEDIDLSKEDYCQGHSQEKIVENNNAFWGHTLEKYLDSVDYAFAKGNDTSKKFWRALDHMPEPKHYLYTTLFIFIVAAIIFLSSCQPAKGQESFTKNQTKQKEQLFIRREKLNLKNKETGSPTGSIWADAPQPKNLLTSFKPSRPGDVVTVNISEDLQFSGDGPGAEPHKNYVPVESLKFEIVSMEPGGMVLLRGSKLLTGQDGETKNILIFAKVSRRDITGPIIDASQLNQVSVNEINNGQSSEYTSSNWDLAVSRKISGYAPDMDAQMAALNHERNTIEKDRQDLVSERKSLEDKKKSLGEEAARLKKDRGRLDGEVARAQSLLDAAGPLVNAAMESAAQQDPKKATSPAAIKPPLTGAKK